MTSVLIYAFIATTLVMIYALIDTTPVLIYTLIVTTPVFIHAFIRHNPCVDPCFDRHNLCYRTNVFFLQDVRLSRCIGSVRQNLTPKSLASLLLAWIEILVLLPFKVCQFVDKGTIRSIDMFCEDHYIFTKADLTPQSLWLKRFTTLKRQLRLLNSVCTYKGSEEFWIQ